MTTVVAGGVVVEIVEVVVVDVVGGGIVVVRFGSVVVELDCGVGIKFVVVFCVGAIVVVFCMGVIVVVLGGVVVVVLGVAVIVVVFCMGVLDVVDLGMGTAVVDFGIVLLFWDVDETIVVVFKACEVGGFVVYKEHLAGLSNSWQIKRKILLNQIVEKIQ